MNNSSKLPLLEFATTAELQEAYAQHLLDTGKETLKGDAIWVAKNETTYNPRLTNRGDIIPDFGFATERDAIINAGTERVTLLNQEREANGLTPFANTLGKRDPS